MTARYKDMKNLITELVNTLEILSGNEMGDSNMTWQDYAAEACITCDNLAGQLRWAAEGTTEPFIVFPSIVEHCEERKDDV